MFIFLQDVIMGVLHLPFLPGFPTVCPKGVPESSAGRAVSPWALPHPRCQGVPRGPVSPSHLHSPHLPMCQLHAEHLVLCLCPLLSLSCFVLLSCPVPHPHVPAGEVTTVPGAGGVTWSGCVRSMLPSVIPCLLCCCSS